MNIKIHPHVKERMEERGATEEEIIKTVEEGENFPVKFGRMGLDGILLLKAFGGVRNIKPNR